MKKIFIIGAALLSVAAGSEILMAQEVQKVVPNATQNFGITYYLPRTAVEVTVHATCTVVKAGIYAPFAEKYLGITDAPQQDVTTWQIDRVAMAPTAQADTSRFYHISFAEKGALPTFYLTPDGCLWGINRAPEPAKPAGLDVPETLAKAEPLAPEHVMNEELLKAGSKSKQAEIAARQIFRIRESRLNLLTGDVDNLPADGASFQLVLANLEAQEQAYMALFTGEKTETAHTQVYTFCADHAVKNTILFRFSQHFGFMAADDLSGAPVTLSMQILEDNRAAAPVVDPKAKKKSSAAQGIAFALPGRAHVVLHYRSEVMAESDFRMGQLGRVEQLPVSKFDDKKNIAKASFNPQTGAILLYEQ